MKERISLEEVIKIFPQLKKDLAGLEVKKIIPIVLTAVANAGGKEIDFSILSQEIDAEIKELPQEVADYEKEKINVLRIWHKEDSGNREMWKTLKILKDFQKGAAELEKQLGSDTWMGLDASNFRKGILKNRVQIFDFLKKMKRADEAIGKITNIHEEILSSLEKRLLILKELKDEGLA